MLGHVTYDAEADEIIAMVVCDRSSTRKPVQYNSRVEVVGHSAMCLEITVINPGYIMEYAPRREGEVFQQGVAFYDEAGDFISIDLREEDSYEVEGDGFTALLGQDTHDITGIRIHGVRRLIRAECISVTDGMQVRNARIA